MESKICAKMENSVCFVIIIHPEHTQYVILLNNLLSGVNRIFFFFFKSCSLY